MGEILARSKTPLKKPIIGHKEHLKHNCYSDVDEKDYFEISRIDSPYEIKNQNVGKKNRKFAYKNQSASTKTFKRLLFVLIVNLIINLSVKLVYSQELHDSSHQSEHLHLIYANEKQQNFEILKQNIISVFPENLNELLIENNFVNSVNQDHLNNYENNNSDNTYVKFHPNHLDFGNQQIGLPKTETIHIFNTGRDSLILDSVSGSTVHFYCSIFTDKVILPGQNTTIDVYYLPREVGHIRNLLFLNTNRGLLKYVISGTGVPNQYGLKPILNQRIYLNSSFSFPIEIFNFHNDSSMQIDEIYTSDDDLHIEIASSSPSSIKQGDYLGENTSNKNKNTQQKSSKTTNQSKPGNSQIVNKSLWTLKPLEKKQVATARFIGHHTNNHSAFIFLKATLNKSNITIKFALPFEIEILENINVYSPIEKIIFGKKKFKPIYPAKQDVYLPSIAFYSDQNAKETLRADKDYLSPYLNLIKGCSNETMDIYLINKSPNNLHVKHVYLKKPNSALSIEFVKNFVLIADPTRLTKVASVQFDILSYDSNYSGNSSGQIVVEMKENNISLEINYNIENNQTGSLNYNQNKLKFFIHIEENFSKIVRSVDFMNTFKFPLVVYGIELNQAAKEYFQIKDFEDSELIKPTVSSNLSDLKFVKNLFRLEFNREKYLKEKNNETVQIRSVDDYFASLPQLTLRTNLTCFKIPIFVYDRYLMFTIVKNEKELHRKTLNHFEFVENLKEENDLGYIMENSVRKIHVVLHNTNPINISITELKLVQIEDNEHDEYQIEFNLKFLRIEPFKFFANFDTTFQEKETIELPAHHRMIVQLEFRNRESKKKENLLDSNVLKYNLLVSTKYQSEKLCFKLVRVNGLIHLINPMNSKQIDHVFLSTYPGLVNIIPINLRSTFPVDLQIKSIRFKKYGNAFNFLWTATQYFRQQDNLPSTQETNKQEILDTIGRINANSLNEIGYVEFDFRKLCSNICYLGLESNSFNLGSDLSIFNDLVDKRTSLYQHWLNTFQVENNQKPVDLVRVDSGLFECMRKRFKQLEHNNQPVFKSELIFELIQRDTSLNSVPQTNLNFTFPFSFRPKWPRIITESYGFMLPIVQASSGYSYKQIKLRNPTNLTILLQLMLIENYPQKEKLLDLIEENDHLFHVNKFIDIKELRKQLKSQNNTSSKVHSNNKIFKFHLGYTQNNKQLMTIKEENLNIKRSKDSLVILLEPSEILTVQINFESKIPGTFHNVLIVRNNLTFLEVHALRGDAGIAFLKVNDLAPMKTSMFPNQFYNKKEFSRYINEMKDVSVIQLKMETSDIKLCQKNRNEGFNYFKNMYHSVISLLSTFFVSSTPNLLLGENSKEAKKCFTYNTQAEHIMRLNEANFAEKKWASSFENDDGIVLRNYIALRNNGNSDLIVENVYINGESCNSAGFSIPYCAPFTVPAFTDELIYLEINYQPDFTMATIDKRLTFKTNIGNLEYILQYRIPYQILSMCHDSLPRPSVETFLFYLILFSSHILALFVVFSAFIESRNIFALQRKVKRKIFNLNEENKQINVHNFVSEYQIQAEKKNTLKLVNRLNNNSNSFSTLTNISKTKNKLAAVHNNNLTTSTATSNNKQPTKSPPSSPSASKNLNKSPKNRQNSLKTTLETQINVKNPNANVLNEKKMAIFNKKSNDKFANLNTHRQLSKTRSESLCVEQLKMTSATYQSNTLPSKENDNFIAKQSSDLPSIKLEKELSPLQSLDIQTQHLVDSKSNVINQLDETFKVRKGSTSSTASSSSRSNEKVKISKFENAPCTIQNNSKNVKKHQRDTKFEKSEINSLIDSKNPSEPPPFSNSFYKMNVTCNTNVNSKPIEDKVKINLTNNHQNFSNDQAQVKQLAKKSKSTTNQQPLVKEQLIPRSKPYPAYHFSSPFDSASEHAKQTLSKKPRSLSMESVQIEKIQLVNDEENDEDNDNQLADEDTFDIHELLESLKRESLFISHSSPSSIGNRSSNSTPMSDIWIMPDFNINDNCLGDDFMDENYDNLVRDTEEFSLKNCCFDVQQQKTITKNTKSPNIEQTSCALMRKNHLLKTTSSPFSAYSDYENIQTIAPIQRPSTATNLLNGSKLDPFEAQFLENQNEFIANNHHSHYFDSNSFKDFKLFDKQCERDEKEECKDESNSNVSSFMNYMRNINSNTNRIWNSVIFDSYASSSLQSTSGSNNIKMLWADDEKKEN